MSNHDVIVIGGGVIGLSVARRLADEGCDVCLLEANRLGQAASHAAAGMLAPSAEAQFGEEALVTLGRQAVEAYPDLAAGLLEETGVDIGYEDRPTLVVAVDRDDAGEIKHIKEYQERLELPVEWMTPSALRELEPWLGPRVFGAVRSPMDHRVDNRALVQALIASLRARSVTIMEECRAELCLEGDRCVGVRQGDNVIRAPDTVVCAGAWSASLAGLPDELTPPVRPVKGQMLSVQLEGGIELRHTIRTPRVYLVPRKDGRVIVGATQEEKGFDTRLTAGGLYELLDNAYEVFPAIYELPILEAWAGLRPGCRDNLPVIGDTGMPGLWMATGHFRNGILLADITARRLVGEMVHGESVEPAFSPQRFSS